MIETVQRHSAYLGARLPESLVPMADELFEAPGEALQRAAGLMDEILHGSPPLIRRYTAYLTGSSGKFLRARSLLSCARNADGLVGPDPVIAAAAVELVHLATLVHDDVIDQADIRRGRPTLRKLFGNKTAVICGDYLVSQGLRLASTLHNRDQYMNRHFQQYLSQVCLGELNQHLNNNNFDLTPLQYFRIINGKTAALFEASFLAGAVTGGETESAWPLYRVLGHHVGMIFQLVDDCLDFEADLLETGKTVQSDYEQHVITLPLIYALAKDPDLKAEAVMAEKRGAKLPRTLINEAVGASRGLAKTHTIAERYADKARAILHQMPIGADKQALLGEIINTALRGGRSIPADLRPDQRQI